MDGNSLRSKASQETFISLLNLEPAPMETPPDTDKDLPPVPEDHSPPASSTTASSKATGSSSLGLSGNGHGAIYFLSRIQRYSSYTLTIFTTIHLATTSLIPLATRSTPASESYLLLAREIYQTRLSEPLLVGLPLLAHITAGLTLRLLRRSQNLRRYGGATPGVYALHRSRGAAAKPHAHSPWPHLSWTAASGLVLAAAVGAHVGVNRVLPLVVEGDSANVGLGFVAHGFARHPGVAWVAYTALVGVGAGHMVWGWARWLGLAAKTGWGDREGRGPVDKKARRRRRRFWLGIHGVAVLLAGVWAAGGLGVVGRGGATTGWLGGVYDGMFAKIWL